MNSFEVLKGKYVVATIDNKMYHTSLDSKQLKAWIMVTFQRDTRTDNGTSDVPFDDCTVTLKAEDWAQFFWLLLDHLLYEQVASLVDCEGLDCTVH